MRHAGFSFHFFALTEKRCNWDFYLIEPIFCRNWAKFLLTNSFEENIYLRTQVQIVKVGDYKPLKVPANSEKVKVLLSSDII